MTTATPTSVVVVPGTHLMPALCGPRDVFLRQIESAFPGAVIHVRGNEVHLEGAEAEVAGRLVEELVVLLQRGQHLDESSLARSIDMIRHDERPSTVRCSPSRCSGSSSPALPSKQGSGSGSSRAI